MIVDISALLAFFDTDEPDHDAVAALLEQAIEPLIVSPFVVAELDYLVASRIGLSAELAMLRELASGAYELPIFGIEDLAEAQTVVERYADQAIGVADASNVVLAARYQTRTIATLDRRHFEVVRPSGGGRFSIVP